MADTVTYAVHGTYTVALTVQDADGNNDGTNQTQFSVITNNVLPAFPFAGEYGVITTGNPTPTLASIAQNGTQLTLNGTNHVTMTIVTSPAELLETGTAVATYQNSTITFSSGTFAGQVWTKLDLPANYTNPIGAPVFVAQNGSAVTFTDKFGKTSPGTWLNPTQLSAFGETVTIDRGPSGGRLFWADGTVWNENLLLNAIQNGAGSATIFALPNQIQVFNYLNANGKATYAISNGTTSLAVIDSLGSMSVATFVNLTQANDLRYPKDMLSIQGSKLVWQDGSVWTPTNNIGSSQPVVTHYTNTVGISTHVIRNGTNSAIFVDSIGSVSVGTFMNGNQVTDPQYPNDLGTFAANTVSWHDGIVWTETANPPIKFTATDANGGVSHLVMQSATIFVGLDGPLQGVTGTRVNDEIDWSNLNIWANFDFDALNALFEMGTLYP
jgi:hypothetical protein